MAFGLKRRWYVLLTGLAGVLLLFTFAPRVLCQKQVVRRAVSSVASKSGREKPRIAAVDQPVASARLDSWRVLGPGGGGAQYTPAVSPHDPNLVLVSCDMGGGYISENGGQSWRMFNLVSRISFFAFDPNGPQVIYAGAGTALWRSDDRGHTWNIVYPDPTVRIQYIDDGATALFLSRLGLLDSITSLAVDPADSNVLYATRGRLLSVSNDRGKTWQGLATLTGMNGRTLIVDPKSPKNNRSIYIISDDRSGFWKDGKWTQNGPPQDTTWIYESAGAFPAGSDKPVLYVISDFRFVNGQPENPAGGFLISRDGGITWQSAAQTFLKTLKDPWILPALRGIGVSQNHPETAYVSYSRYVTADGGPFFGVARTDDYAATWRTVWKEFDQSADNIHDAWLSNGLGADWGENPVAIGVAPNNPDLAFATDLGRTMRTADGGKTWAAVYSSRLADDIYATNGLDVTTSYGVHFDPFDANRMFISYTDIGLFRSENGGKGWQLSTSGIPRIWSNTAYWVEFDPAVKGKMWAAMSRTHDLPRAYTVSKSPIATLQGGVAASDDGGVTWRVSSGGMPQAAITHIVLDPSSPADARVLYAAAFGRGVYKSIDGGRNWTLKRNGLAGAEPLAWRLARDKKGVLYLIAFRKSFDGKFGNDGDGALYRSRDGAETWERMTLPEGVNGPSGLAIDAADPNRLYLANWCRSDPVFGTASQGGIYVSSDAGQNWRYVFDADQYVYDVTIDPDDPATLYAAGFQSSAWRSIDRGESWQRIRGYNFKAGHRVIPDPRNRGMIFITTFGGSVWYGPAAGDPAAVEDVTPSGVALFNKRNIRVANRR